MISYYKQQEQIGERQRAEMKANAGKPATFDFRSADELRADWDKQKAQAEASQSAGKRKVASRPATVATPHDKNMIAPQESFGNPSDPCTFKG